MSHSRITLSQKLFGYYFALCIATIITLSTYSYFAAKNALINRTFEQLNSVKFEKQLNIERYLKERILEVAEISNASNWMPIIEKSKDRSLSPDDYLEFIKSEFFKKFKRYFSGNSNYSEVVFNCSNRVNVAIELGNDENPDNFFLPEHYSLPYNALIKKTNDIEGAHLIESEIGDLFIGSVINSCECNNSKGVVLLKLNPDVINKMMFNSNKMNGLGETGEAYIVDSNKLMRTTSRFNKSLEKYIVVNTEGAEAALQNISGTGQYKDYRDITVLGAYGKINVPGLNWAILTEIDLKEAMIPIYTLRNSIIILSLIISLLIFGIVFIISKRISQPVINLKNAADNISNGNYEIYIENNSKDEIGELSDAFNQMIDKIKEQKREIYEERSMRITSVFDGQEQERQRLARELHDGLGQRILAVKMQLERIENASPELKQKLVTDARTMLATISKEVVDMSENLMPHVLTEFGLISAIESLCEEVKTLRGINVSLKVNEIPADCRADVKIYLYRIIQEALNNIVKHSEAKNVDIRFYYKNNRIELTVADDGKGFDVNSIRKGSNGIYNMRDRVEILGGTMNIRSLPNQGTTIEVMVDIDKENQK